MKHLRYLLSVAAASWLVLLSHPSFGANSVESNRKIAEAKLLLDTYYGKQENLESAATLLGDVLGKDKKNANAYVQAARLTIQAGDSVESYHALLDIALAIDPTNRKAFILKAGAYDIQKNYSQEEAALDKAKELGSTDSWLYMGYARYYGRVGDETSSRYFYSQVKARGPGDSPEQRRAYVSALTSLVRFLPQEPSEPIELARLAWRERYPTDAWTLGTFANEFIFRGVFDDAVVFGREAVRTMDYHVGRRTLAVALYGRAAQLILLDQTAQANKLIDEAQRLSVSPSDVMSRFEAFNGGEIMDKLMPILTKIVQ
jgi:tetratricopeptide (TPR) repeat protein